ncbi:TATA-box-binding protein [Xenopus laevis]|uniref:TATA box-binding protein-like 1 n=1 Tax=Xenopus laevis TaxID=8355 RepID=A0A8J1KUW1_XENLA|nr:TATA-box-binding protein [Xenopus laevis]
MEVYFESSKLSCSKEEAKVGARRLARSLQKLGFQVKFTEYKVVNVLAVCTMPFEIRLNEFTRRNRPHASYEPELHPAVRYRIKSLRATLQIFSTGSITVTAEWIQDDPEFDGDIAPPDQAAPPPPDEAALPPVQAPSPQRAAPLPERAAAPPPDQAPPPNQGLSVGTQTENAYYDHTELLVTLVHQVNAIRQDLGEVREIVESLQRVVAPPPPL